MRLLGNSFGKTECGLCGGEIGLLGYRKPGRRSSKRSMKLCSLFVSICIVLAMTACGNANPEKETASSTPESTTGSAVTTTPEPEPEQEYDSEPDLSTLVDPAETERDYVALDDAATYSRDFDGEITEGQAALKRLRSCMESQPKAPLAAACLADPTYRDSDSLREYLRENFSYMVETQPFLLDIPEKQILGEGELLYCVVPRDDSTSLAVNRVSWKSSGSSGPWDFPESQVEEILYRSEYAEPLLVFVGYDFVDDNNRRRPDIEICAVAGNGAKVVWYPDCYPETFIINAPFDEDYDPLILALDNLIANGLDNREDGYDYGDDDWEAPTELGLADTNWYCGNDWYISLSGYDNNAPYYAGLADIYQISANGTEYSGVWKMDGKCLYLQVADGVGNITEGCYPVEISPSGEELSIREDPKSGARPVFFREDMAAMTLTLD